VSIVQLGQYLSLEESEESDSSLVQIEVEVEVEVEGGCALAVVALSCVWRGTCDCD